MPLVVDIGVFAHNEVAGISTMLAHLAAQDIWTAEDISARVLVLANGCTDATVATARDTAAAFGARLQPEVCDFPLGGKSRTWNRFVHELARADADVLIFCDADIEFCGSDALQRLARGLRARPPLWVLNSQPVKDIVARPQALSALDKIIAAASGGLDDWKSAICGQLYAMPAHHARGLHLPIGLPVEDGFLRAMVLTDALTQPEDFSRIDGLDGLCHIYVSERSVSALIRHQIRIVIGSAVNAACFAAIRNVTATQRRTALATAAAQDDWLTNVIQQRLPRLPYGFVPVHFLTKRLARFARTPRDLLRPRRVFVAVLGFGFDLIVYLRAQVAMWRGKGAGFW